jgi:dienelactone hydrolase
MSLNRNSNLTTVPAAARTLIGLMIFAQFIGSVAAQPAAAVSAGKQPADPFVHDQFVSGGQTIKVWRFEPVGTGPYPAVLMLHGLDGPQGTKAAYCSIAQRLVAKGYMVLLVHYFDRTDTRGPVLAKIQDQFRRSRHETLNADESARLWEHFRAWRSTVEDAVGYARALPKVAPRRLGVIGFSLGGYLALAVGAREDLKLSAVIELFAGLPQDPLRKINHLPPTLGFHGDADDVVPVKEAHELRAMLTARKLAGEVVIFKGVGHVFITKGQSNFVEALAAEQIASGFLEKHLKPGKLGKTVE